MARGRLIDNIPETNVTGLRLCRTAEDISPRSQDMSSSITRAYVARVFPLIDSVMLLQMRPIYVHVEFKSSINHHF